MENQNNEPPTVVMCGKMHKCPTTPRGKSSSISSASTPWTP